MHRNHLGMKLLVCTVHQLATLAFSSTTIINPPDVRQKNTCHTLPHLPQTQGQSNTPLRQEQMLSLHCNVCLLLLKRQTQNKESPHVEETESALESQKNKPQTKLV